MMFVVIVVRHAANSAEINATGSYRVQRITSTKQLACQIAKPRLIYSELPLIILL